MFLRKCVLEDVFKIGGGVIHIFYEIQRFSFHDSDPREEKAGIYQEIIKNIKIICRSTPVKILEFSEKIPRNIIDIIDNKIKFPTLKFFAN